MRAARISMRVASIFAVTVFVLGCGLAAGDPPSNEDGFEDGGAGGGAAGAANEGGDGSGLAAARAARPNDDGGGGTGEAGGDGCTPIEWSAFEHEYHDGNKAWFRASLLDATGFDEPIVWAEFRGDPYTGAAVGTFDLSAGVDTSYATCGRCLRVMETSGREFFQSRGTITIDEASRQLDGSVSATITGLEMVEVTVSNNGYSTPVPGGACVRIESASILVTAPATR